MEINRNQRRRHMPDAFTRLKLSSSKTAPTVKQAFLVPGIRAGASLVILITAYTVQMPELVKLLLLVGAAMVSGLGMLEYAASLLLRRRFFEKDVLITLIVAGAFAIGRQAEAVVIVITVLICETVEAYIVTRARRYIRSEIDVKPETVAVFHGETVEDVAPDSVAPGESILVRAGEIIGLDGIITEGEADVDTLPLTGEREPRPAKAGHLVFAGCIPDADLKICVTASLADSAVSRILDTIGWADNRTGKTEHSINVLSGYFTYAVMAIAVIIGVLVPLIGRLSYGVWLYKALAAAVAALPCALTVSVPLTYLAAIGGAAKKGVLFKGANAIDLTSRVTSVVFDKTGTLTKGEFKVTSVNPVGVSEKELLTLAVYAEARSHHPLATAILNYAKVEINERLISDYREMKGMGSIARLAGDRLVIAGSNAFFNELKIPHETVNDRGTAVYIALGRKCVGCVCLSDDAKSDANNVVERLNDIGIDRIAMISGDKADSAREIAGLLGITEVYANLRPGEKKDKLVSLHDMQLEGDKLAFVGDGTDDLDLMSIADIGIAIGRLKADFSVEKADVLLISDAPTRVSDAVMVARHAAAVRTQNITSAMCLKFLILLFSLAFGAPIWLAVLLESLLTLADEVNAIRAYSPEKYDFNVLYDRFIKFMMKRRIDTMKFKQRERIKKYKDR